MQSRTMVGVLVLGWAVLSMAVGEVTASPYATTVISYTAGSNAASGYTDPSVALGEPSRVTGSGAWVGDVTVFNAPYLPSQIVSIGAGGSLVVRFGQSVLDAPANPFGLDLLIFGNAFFYGSGGVASSIWAEPAKVAVSQDGTTWYDIPGVFADGLFPTQGYTDTSDPYGSDGKTPTDFTKPVNPAIEWTGKTYAEILALYDGSGGGTGVDISVTGLPWIRYVKVYQDAADTWSAEIDAFTIIPEPATLALIGLGIVGLWAKRKRIPNSCTRERGNSMGRILAIASGMILVLAAPLLAGMTPLGITVPGPPSGAWTTLLATDAAGAVYACDGDAVFGLDKVSGAFSAIFTDIGTAAGVSVDPSGFAVSPDGTLAYVATGRTGRIVEVNLGAGTARELSGARSPLSNYGLAVDPIYGQVFMTDAYTQELARVELSGNGSLTSLDTFGNEGAFGGGIGFAPDGTLIAPVPTAYSDWQHGEDDFPANLYRFSRTWLDSVAGGTTPSGGGVCYAMNVQVSGTGAVAVDKRGDAYLLALDAIYKVSAAGSASVLVGDPSQNVFIMVGYGFMGLAYDEPRDRLLFAYRETASQDWALYEYVVPEPATVGLLALAASGMIWRRRRQ